MKRISLSIFIVLLTGCGGSDGGKEQDENQASFTQGDFKKNPEIIVDQETGKTLEQITVSSDETTTVTLKNNEVFSLTSSESKAEALVIKGSLTIK
jgi:major membrane immunogen (membrane-anchored lipoprotein)